MPIRLGLYEFGSGSTTVMRESVYVRGILERYLIVKHGSGADVITIPDNCTPEQAAQIVAAAKGGLKEA